MLSRSHFLALQGEINVIYITLDIYSIPQLDEKKEVLLKNVLAAHEEVEIFG